MLANPKHPGQVLKALYIEPAGLNANRLAIALDVPRTRITRLIAGQTDMSADTALRLAKFFNTTAQYWMNMQTNYNLAKEAKNTNLAAVQQFVKA